MTYTITLSWWLIPALISLACFSFATVVSFRQEPDRFGVAGLMSLGLYMAASIVSLIAWLAWALA